MGSREGGLAAAKTLKQKYGDAFYANIGSAGSAGKGFDHPTICNIAQKCNEIPDNLNNRKGDVKK